MNRLLYRLTKMMVDLHVKIANKLMWWWSNSHGSRSVSSADCLVHAKGVCIRIQGFYWLNLHPLANARKLTRVQWVQNLLFSWSGNWVQLSRLCNSVKRPLIDECQRNSFQFLISLPTAEVDFVLADLFYRNSPPEAVFIMDAPSHLLFCALQLKW